MFRMALWNYTTLTDVAEPSASPQITNTEPSY